MAPPTLVVGSVGALSCPLCHTPAALAVVRDGEPEWTCAACGQNWDRERLERVSAYAAYVATRAMRDVPSPASVVHPAR